MTNVANDIRESVRSRYAKAASAAAAAPNCCGNWEGEKDRDADGNVVFGAELYGADAAELSGSLGCGVPTEVAELHPGETVLDLGSGAGGDVFLAARRVGEQGRVIGVDMTTEMLELARAKAAAAGVTNVEFVQGYLEAIPLPDGSIDIVISNCVLNLAADKSLVLAEVARVLRAGGRLAFSDVIADEDMDAATRADMAAWTGCIAGALTEAELVSALGSAGFVDIEVRPTHRVHAAAQAAIIRANHPGMVDDLPAGCSLNGQDGAARTRRWRTLAELAPPQSWRKGRTLTVRFTSIAGAYEELAALAVAEQACCPNLGWVVTNEDQGPTLRVTADADSSEDLDSITALFESAGI